MHTIILLNGNIISILIIYFVLNFFGVSKFSKRIFILSFIPFIFQTWSLVENMFTNSSFNIVNGEIIYGKIYFLHNLMLIISLISCLSIATIKRKNVPKYEYKVILLIGFLLSIPLVINIFAKNLIIFWDMNTYIIIAFYSIMQEKIVEYDATTGAISMQYFSAFTLREMIEKRKKYTVALLDVDNLTEINNTFGVEEGDVILKKIVEEIIKVKREKDKVVRMVGDKFLIIFDTDDLKVVSKIIKKFEEKINDYNIKSYKKYNIEFSLYYEVFNYNDSLFEDCVRKLTTYIYNIKKQKLIEYENKYKVSLK